MDSILKTVLDNDYATLKGYVEQKVQEGINAKIASKKVDILAALNGISRDKMEEVMSVS